MPADKKLFADLTVQQVNDDPFPGMMVIDVREQHEWDEGHVKDCVLIPMGELQDALYSDPRFEDTTRHLVMYCQSGNRSAQAAQFLAECGFENVYNLVGGIIAWTAADFPIEKG